MFANSENFETYDFGLVHFILTSLKPLTLIICEVVPKFK